MKVCGDCICVHHITSCLMRKLNLLSQIPDIRMHGKGRHVPLVWSVVGLLETILSTSLHLLHDIRDGLSRRWFSGLMLAQHLHAIFCYL